VAAKSDYSTVPFHFLMLTKTQAGTIKRLTHITLHRAAFSWKIEEVVKIKNFSILPRGNKNLI